MDGTICNFDLDHGGRNLAHFISSCFGGGGVGTGICGIFSRFRGQYFGRSYHGIVAHLAAQIEYCQSDCRPGNADRQAQHALTHARLRIW